MCGNTLFLCVKTGDPYIIIYYFLIKFYIGLTEDPLLVPEVGSFSNAYIFENNFSQGSNFLIGVNFLNGGQILEIIYYDQKLGLFQYTVNSHLKAHAPILGDTL